jgi:hypothetical protein
VAAAAVRIETLSFLVDMLAVLYDGTKTSIEPGSEYRMFIKGYLDGICLAPFYVIPVTVSHVNFLVPLIGSSFIITGI